MYVIGQTCDFWVGIAKLGQLTNRKAQISNQGRGLRKKRQRFFLRSNKRASPSGVIPMFLYRHLKLIPFSLFLGKWLWSEHPLNSRQGAGISLWPSAMLFQPKEKKRTNGFSF